MLHYCCPHSLQHLCSGLIIHTECGRLAASAGSGSIWSVTLSSLAGEQCQAVLEPPWHVGAGQKGCSSGCGQVPLQHRSTHQTPQVNRSSGSIHKVCQVSKLDGLEGKNKTVKTFSPPFFIFLVLLHPSICCHCLS